MEASYPIRQTLLSVISESGSRMQAQTVLRETKERLKGRNIPDESILTVWWDLFRTGLLAWGEDIANPHWPSFHPTKRGRAALANLSRDPANPEGYLSHLQQVADLEEEITGYVAEALQCYISGCFRAAAVMIGVASEKLALELRDELLAAEIGSRSQLSEDRVKFVLEAIRKALDGIKGEMPGKLRESYDVHWASLSNSIRLMRNDAGHPRPIGTVDHNDAHAALLMFPSLAQLTVSLRAWIEERDNESRRAT